MATGRAAQLENRTMASRKRGPQPSGASEKRPARSNRARRALKQKVAPAVDDNQESSDETPQDSLEQEPSLLADKELKDTQLPKLRPRSFARTEERGLARADPLQLYMAE